MPWEIRRTPYREAERQDPDNAEIIGWEELSGNAMAKAAELANRIYIDWQPYRDGRPTWNSVDADMFIGWDYTGSPEFSYPPDNTYFIVKVD